MAQSSRRYIKRVWRVPKDRGALEYFAALVVKLMVKHGWPAKWKYTEDYGDHGAVVGGFVVFEQGQEDGDLPPDMERAFECACRIVAKTYRVEYVQRFNWAGLTREYRVSQGGHFREVKG